MDFQLFPPPRTPCVHCRASDYSIALPDLEIDPEAQMEIEREVVGAPVLVSQSPGIACKLIKTEIFSSEDDVRQCK